MPYKVKERISKEGEKKGKKTKIHKVYPTYNRRNPKTIKPK